MFFPGSASWARIISSRDFYSAVPLLAYFIPTGFLVASYNRKLSTSRMLVFIPIGMAVGFAVTFPYAGMHGLAVYILTALTFSIFGGLGEEIFFRGLLMEELMKKTKTYLAVVLQAVAFGLSHPWNPAVVMGATIFGLFLGVLRKYLGLEASIGLHFGINIFTHA